MNNQEEIQLSNNRENPSLRWKNYQFNFKNKGKMSASFVCSTPGCYVSISLRVLNNEIKEPFEISHRNENHKDNCLPRNDKFFEIRDFMKIIKTKLTENIAKPTQQVYEEVKAAHRVISDTTLPDYSEVSKNI